MKFLRVIFIIGYLFWGGMFLSALSELILRNAWFELFEIEEIKPSKLEYLRLDESSVEIKYEFEIGDKTYEGSRQVIDQIVKARLPANHEEITVSFNSLFPQVNYLGQLGLKTRTGYLGVTISSIFIIFLLLIDIFGNKKKWLKLYGMDNEKA